MVERALCKTEINLYFVSGLESAEKKKGAVWAERGRMLLKFKMARIRHKALSDSLGMINVEDLPVWSVLE